METFSDIDQLNAPLKVARFEVVPARTLPADVQNFLTELEKAFQKELKLDTDPHLVCTDFCGRGSLYRSTMALIAYPKQSSVIEGTLLERLCHAIALFWLSGKLVYVDGQKILMAFGYLARVKASVRGSGIAVEGAMSMAVLLKHGIARLLREDASMGGAGGGYVHVRNRASLRFNMKMSQWPMGIIGSHLIRLADLVHSAAPSHPSQLVPRPLSAEETRARWLARFGKHNQMLVHPEELLLQRPYGGTFVLSDGAESSVGVSVWLPGEYARAVDPTLGESAQCHRPTPFAMLFNVWAEGPASTQLFVSLLRQLPALLPPAGHSLSHLVLLLWRHPVADLERAVHDPDRVHRLDWQDCFIATDLEHLTLTLAAGSEYEYYMVGHASHCSMGSFARLTDPFTDPRDSSTLVSFHRATVPPLRALL
mmetsp:Transcript_12271/g.37154  ORF Transcript_12271/g.37154 Transcript_12271/m.37154 type:complete len:424 (-) Transcript_12271:37-1308(-)|eukprot:CAMPEP_0177640686 /NCGR_PEP_ID=MMETSP0447-20121125/6673_1 /TAXON_ID=0 /ORGANISM="Stygamoeba regulata, Strain BSH-02190019" /LENGTH=423 /DNA_ID=CAMNT_0019142769 /DNA_START=119 /DNA_END=1390 /DNA_ORIENTATION=-